LEQAGSIDPPKITPDGLRAGTLAFVQDFLLEHSLSGLDIASTEISSSF
jgi:hypothetical protein